ncbi:inhibitor of apoptosis-promoting Bax1 protein [Medicago truncatula]|uniref:Inhibitor of apoptosis-promoting Bax1 protein n=1 Tax=Medicago truncatula TaxID=3880 RepID=A0A072UB51_MEDTR|nr:inhibitor of apoptosis-promoting Bax1 protein [Medicago truncatula]
MTQYDYDAWTYKQRLDKAKSSHIFNNNNVYLTLCFVVVAAAIGAYLHVLLNIGGILTTIACLGISVWLLSTPPSEERMRLTLLMAATLFQGASVGPLIDFSIQVDPNIIFSSFVATSLAFGCFSGATLVAKRREYLYLGGLVSSGLSILIWFHLASAIFGVFFRNLAIILNNSGKRAEEEKKKKKRRE